MKRIAVILMLMSAASLQAEVSRAAPNDSTLARLTNGMTQAQIQTILGVAGRPRENTPLNRQILEYDFDGLSVCVDLAPTGEDKTPRAVQIRIHRDGLTVVERNDLRAKKWAEWVGAHQVKTNGVPNQPSARTR